MDTVDEMDCFDEYVVSVQYRGFIHHEGVSIDQSIPGDDSARQLVCRSAQIALQYVRRRADEHRGMRELIRQTR